MVHIVYTKHVTSNWPKSGLVFKSLTSEWQAHDSCFFCYNFIFIFFYNYIFIFQIILYI